MSKIAHRRIRANGIDVHIAEMGRGPLVVLLHGFPDLGYAWRHQLEALADAGYHAVAPDLRGYGETDAPAAVEDYSMFKMIGDVVGTLDALDARTAVLVGHDWGARIVSIFTPAPSPEPASGGRSIGTATWTGMPRSSRPTSVCRSCRRRCSWPANRTALFVSPRWIR